MCAFKLFALNFDSCRMLIGCLESFSLIFTYRFYCANIDSQNAKVERRSA